MITDRARVLHIDKLAWVALAAIKPIDSGCSTYTFNIDVAMAQHLVWQRPAGAGYFACLWCGRLRKQHQLLLLGCSLWQL